VRQPDQKPEAKSLLKMTGIKKRFDGIHALRDASLEVGRGEVHAIVGENGAGKSTMMKILAGVYPADAGSISFDGQWVQPHSYRESVNTGISMIFQDTSLFENLTVAENLLFDRFPRTWFGALSYRKLFARAKLSLRNLDFDIPPEVKVSDLTVGARQLIEIAKAVATGSKLVIMDEATASLNSQESENLFNLIAKLRSASISIIYISHRLDEVFRISDRLTVLRDGRSIATHKTANTDQKEVILQMVGRGVETRTAQPELGSNDRPVVLDVDNLAIAGKLREVSFSLMEGEILGVAGLRGVGQEHLIGVLLGLEPNYSGTIRIAGKQTRIRSTMEAVACGISYVTDDRKGKGLLLDRDAAYNGTLGSIQKISRGGFLQAGLEKIVAERQALQFAISTKRPSMPVKYLSGGNQQKVVLARALEQEPKILILNEPTAGIDIGAKEEIHKLLLELTMKGMAIILISSDLPELMALSHRILVLNQKSAARIISPESANDASIIEAAVT
jgi:ABC-type sugar transport system ATPase subunit